MKLNGVQQYTHRLVYTLYKGPIPQGLVLDHLCRTPCCCNPEHMEAVTSGENLMRGPGSKTHCFRGHLYTEQTTGHNGPRTGGGMRRYCLTCKNEKRRKTVK